MKYKVFEMKNGLITFTKEELANLLEEVYNEGRASVIPLIDLPPKKSNPITAPSYGSGSEFTYRETTDWGKIE